jgi:hypothetical protein
MEQEALKILREFVMDVMAAYGNDHHAAVAALEVEWPDLADTFEKARALVKRAGNSAR